MTRLWVRFSCLLWSERELRSLGGLVVQFCHWCSGDAGLNPSYCICFFMPSRRLVAIGDIERNRSPLWIVHKLRCLVIPLGSERLDWIWQSRSEHSLPFLRCKCAEKHTLQESAVYHCLDGFLSSSLMLPSEFE